MLRIPVIAALAAQHARVVYIASVNAVVLTPSQIAGVIQLADIVLNALRHQPGHLGLRDGKGIHAADGLGHTGYPVQSRHNPGVVDALLPAVPSCVLGPGAAHLDVITVYPLGLRLQRGGIFIQAFLRPFITCLTQEKHRAFVQGQEQLCTGGQRGPKCFRRCPNHMDELKVQIAVIQAFHRLKDRAVAHSRGRGRKPVGITRLKFFRKRKGDSGPGKLLLSS